MDQNRGEPALYGLNRPEMQDVALASDETNLKRNTFTGFRVATYMAKGNKLPAGGEHVSPGADGDCDGGHAEGRGECLHIGGRCRPDQHVGGRSPRGPHLPSGHRRKHQGKQDFLPKNKALLSLLIDDDMKEYRQRRFSVAASVEIGAAGDREHPPVVK